MSLRRGPRRKSSVLRNGSLPTPPRWCSITKVFRADVSAGPKIVYSGEMATELVSAIPGAVAFVPASKVPKGLKTLKIDGHLPSEKEHPLR